MTSVLDAPFAGPLGMAPGLGARRSGTPGMAVVGGRAGPGTLADARRAMGLTMAEFARAMHVCRTTVSLWEKGHRRPARYRWPLLGAVLQLQPDEVAGLLTDHPPARHDGMALPSLAVVRQRSGLTQRAVAQSVGVAPTTLSTWENAGVPVPPVAAERLARVLNTDLACMAAEPSSARVADRRPLRRLRKDAGMSQREAAAHLGIAVGTLARYESGARQTPVKVVRSMARMYRRPVGDVLRHSGITLPAVPGRTPWLLTEVAGGIRAARTLAGMTKVELGRALGRSGQAVHGWETGRTRPNSRTCRRLELLLGLFVGALPY
jgi:transcriptional regulator with XRE-family HTH domain